VTLKACTVVVHDLNDTAHALNVTAETLYEAVAQVLATYVVTTWVSDIRLGVGPQPDASSVVACVRVRMTC